MRIWERLATKRGDEATSAPRAGAVSASAAPVASMDPALPGAEGADDSRVTFSRVYDDHVDFIWRSARRLGVTEDAVDDVVQQVFVVVHRRFGEFEGRASVKTWLFAILIRVVRDHRRSLRRKSPHLSGDPTDPDALADSAQMSDPYEALSRVEASRLINQLLDALEEDRRIVFVMAELEQMMPAEIAEALGVDAKLVYARLRAGRADFEQAAARLRRREERGGLP
jgi:RNA polymerase sigma-70 factor, ECF subfamily